MCFFRVHISIYKFFSFQLLVVPDLCEKYATDFLTKEYAINPNDMANRYSPSSFKFANFVHLDARGSI